MQLKKCLTFEDVTLVPKYSNIESRSIPNLKTKLSQNITIDLPFIPSNMDSVISIEMAKVLVCNGGKPIFHRFTSLEQQQDWVKQFPQNCLVSFGVDIQIDQLKRFKDLGALGACFDIAHAHTSYALKLIEKIKKEIPTGFDLVIGNITTSDAYIDVIRAGGDACKLGIGSGSCCTTREITGFGVGMVTAILDCAEEYKKYKIPIISDGSIRKPCDVAKALAAGAHSVMMGKIFALTYEGAGKTREISGKIQKRVRGQASYEFQAEYKGGLRPGTVAEGEAFWGNATYSTQEVLDYYAGALRSSLTYGGSKTIEEFTRKAEFMEVSNYYQIESRVRPD